MFVLASTSRYRRAQLEALGVSFLCAAPPYEEDHALPLPPAELVVRFARGKAESLGARHPDLPIVGGDQAVELDGRMLGKPGTRARAVEQLEGMSGRTHRLLTALALHDPRRGTTEHTLVVHEMKLKALSRAQIEAYVDREDPVDCAGSYKVEGLGILLFESLPGPDPSAIIGLPITALSELLRRAGVDLLDDALGRRRAQ